MPYLKKGILILKMNSLRNNLIILFIICLISSCTHINVINNGKYLVKLNRKKTDLQKITFKNNVEFYFWGMLPSEHNIDISKLIDQEWIYKDISGVSYIEYQTFLQSFQQLLSLGLYIPKSFKVKAYVQNN